MFFGRTLLTATVVAASLGAGCWLRVALPQHDLAAASRTKGVRHA
ncbi:hypothetical protein GGD83_003927 [Rhodoblastus sphagnicola]|nr:hypothetical protein [Rhodoblastus sphagnicola]MBB4200100.1 hypothetical protein [Rhodoblastus sphagnicola]